MIENRIKQLRKQKGLTLQEVADRCFPQTVSPQIQKLERGERGLDLSWMERLAKALDVKPYELLPESWQPQESNITSVVTDWQYIVDIFDTLDFYLKSEKCAMEDSDKIRLVSFLYDNKLVKEKMILKKITKFFTIYPILPLF